jgi:hypothetical protein
MLRTLWTVTAAGLLALCMTGCGGGTDYPSKICDKMKSCNPTMTAADVTACKATTNQNLSTIPASMKSQVDQEIDACLTQACPLIESCLNALPTTDAVTDACNKANSCSLLSQMGYSSVSQCVSEGQASLNAAGSQKSTVENAISACTKQADCSVFAYCIQNLGGP